MSSQHAIAFVLIALLGSACLPAAPAHAQSPAQDPAQNQDQNQAQGGADQAQGGGDQGQGGAQKGAEDIDQLLAGEEQVLAGEGYSYEPGSRRDPFKSLLVTTQLPSSRGPRPEGIPGLLIDEVIVTGIFHTDRGYVAQVQSAENEKSYLVKEGDQLYDGDILRITDNEIVFKQIVQDPTALKPFREVVKTLNPEKG